MRTLSRLSLQLLIALLVSAIVLVLFWALTQQTWGRRWVANEALVQTENGWAQGWRMPGYSVFWGLPYAQAPVGDLRFAPPEPASNWQGSRMALWPQSSCAQPAVPDLRVPQSLSEDCLYLNVFKPVNKTAQPLPVMVWLHGGGFVLGSGNFTLGSRLAQEGQVLLVSINYRLGTLGFLAHPALGAENGQAIGNYGLLDQQAAIAWVKRNAAAFGGDPNNITLFGQSAGGSGVCAHLMSPAMRGQFQAAIVQSGVCTDQLMQSMGEALSLGEDIAQELGCQGAGREVVACLREQPVQNLLRVMGQVSVTSERPLRPVYGSTVLPEAPELAFASGHFHRLPVLVGSTRNEGSLLQALELNQANARLDAPLSAEALRQTDTPERYALALKNYFGEEGVAPILQRYTLARYGKPSNALSAVLTDALFACGAHSMRSGLAAAGAPVYAYEFSEAPPGDLIKNDISGVDLGAYHGAEFSSLFFYPFHRLQPEQKALAKDLRAYWSSFARQHRPMVRGGAAWPPFSQAQPRVLDLKAGAIRPLEDFAERHHCDFWLSPEAPPMRQRLGMDLAPLQKQAQPQATASATATARPSAVPTVAATATVTANPSPVAQPSLAPSL